MKTEQSPLDSESQIWCVDLSSADQVADVIALLMDENDRLRQMAALLGAETEFMRQSLLLVKSTDWRPVARLRAVP
jgi:hypothetical protein